MKEKKRGSLHERVCLRRRFSVLEKINHYLDRLVDIFDFPLEPPAYAQSDNARNYSTSAAEGIYTSKDRTSFLQTRNRGNTSADYPRSHRISMENRAREWLPSSSRSRPSKSTEQKTMSVWNGSKKMSNVPRPTELQMSCLTVRRKPTLKEPRNEQWIECKDLSLPNW
ncbi:unnamed protein product [Phytophthora fragariaefolia]|uniref:Unnamed protein product n=1 Tax=Phytophthora fragariaefolia TaxID=1490495 RepID=A0A9W6TVT1_9STRA|nr:unnamed protein product [Phytophthora fragariaefolia]